MVVSLSILIEFVSMILCLHYLYGQKVKFDAKTIGVIIVEFILMQFIHYGKLSQVWSILIYPVTVIYCSWKFGFDLKEIAVNNILCVIIVGCLQLSMMLLIKTIFVIFIDDTIQGLVINICLFLSMVGILRKCKLDVFSEYLQGKERLMKITFGLATCVMIICLLRAKWINGFDLVSYVSLLICIVLICIITASMGKYKLKMKEAETELKMYKIYENSFASLIDNIRSRQHEFDNHINAIYSQHFSYSTYEELVRAQTAYCKDIINENHFNKLLSKGNPIILGFLYGKFLEIEKLGIEISYKINIKDMNGEIPVYKMVEILGNLINNAVEAIKINERVGKLFVVMKEMDDKIEIEVGNECKIIDYNEIQKYFEKGYSEKGKNRGYGLYNVKKICDTYKMKIECSNREIDERNFLIFKIVNDKKPFVK